MIRIFSLFISLAVMSSAQTAPEATSPSKVSLFGILEQGGVMMYPLALLSIIAVFLICIYSILITRRNVVSNQFMLRAEELIFSGEVNKLSALCAKNSSSISKVIGRAVDFYLGTPKSSLDDIREVAQAEGSRQASKLSQRIAYLSDIGNIAPMVGLLGTVIGMIRSFMEISQGNFEGVKQMKLAAGVSEALITTAGGLIIGIIAVIFYSVFRARVQRYIAELEAATTHILAMISSNSKK